jgi:hypothetical protein
LNHDSVTKQQTKGIDMTDHDIRWSDRLQFDRRRPMPLIRSALMFVAGVIVAAVWLGFTRG